MPAGLRSKHAVRDRSDAAELVARRHPEYLAYVATSQWLLDTMKGGASYRDAEYGDDGRGNPIRNLYRHKREYVDIGGVATDESGNPLPFASTYAESLDRAAAIELDYEIRRQRTPVPQFMSSYIEKLLSKIYKRPIKRDGPDVLKAWSDDIDGRQTSLDDWMRETVAPLVVALGMLDLYFGHPFRQPDEPALFGDDLTAPERRCVCKHILPENVLWWKLDYTGRYYLEVIILESGEDDDGNEIPLYRHWTHEDWTLYTGDGDIVGESMHNFGVVPIVRVFDRRDLSTDNTALSRMWPVADKSRAYYNEESELVANNTMHNCPLLQGPDAGDNDESVPVNRYYMLKKYIEPSKGNVVEYSYLGPPTETVQFMRLRLFDIQDRMERDVALTRSVGAVATGDASGPVAQSGISKAYDQIEGSEYLASIAKSLQGVEYTAWYFALIVIKDGFARVSPEDIAAISIVYPKEFNLLSFDQYALILDTQSRYIQGGLGLVPTDEKLTLKSLARMKHPDLSAAELEEIDAEIDALVDSAVERRKNDGMSAGNDPANGNRLPAANRGVA